MLLTGSSLSDTATTAIGAVAIVIACTFLALAEWREKHSYRNDLVKAAICFVWIVGFVIAPFALTDLAPRVAPNIFASLIVLAVIAYGFAALVCRCQFRTVRGPMTYVASTAPLALAVFASCIILFVAIEAFAFAP